MLCYVMIYRVRFRHRSNGALRGVPHLRRPTQRLAPESFWLGPTYTRTGGADPSRPLPAVTGVQGGIGPPPLPPWLFTPTRNTLHGVCTILPFRLVIIDYHGLLY